VWSCFSETVYDTKMASLISYPGHRQEGMMHLMWKQMEQVVKDALQREGLTIEERLGMIVTAMDARRLPYDAARIEKMRKYLKQCVEMREGRRKSP